MDQNHTNASSPFNYRSSSSSSSGWLEIRLFYVRITPCAVNTVPENLTLRNLRREIGVSLEINGVRVPSSDTSLVTLRRDRVDKESSEVTYVSTDNIRVTGPIEFEVIDNNININKINCNGNGNGSINNNVNNGFDDKDMILCGSLERIENNWSNGGGLDNGNGNCGHGGWSMDFCAANLMKFGTSSPSIEVYIAGCCSSVPVILTKTINVSPRRRGGIRHGVLDAIPEDEEVDKGVVRENGVVRQRKLPHTGEEADEYAPELKVGPSYYSDEMYYDEDGQLTWFNAGVRVGVGIGLGMCLGIGIGVGLLMRSYQATTRNFRRRFF